MDYKLSFTSISLAPAESVNIARLYQNRAKWDGVDEAAKSEKALNRTKSASVIRMIRELRQRLQKLTSDQLNLLVVADSETQRKILLLAVCKTYPFVTDFLFEVVRRKYQVFDFQLNESDYARFFREKAELHSELAELAQSTQKKLRQVLFLILAESGIINNPKDKTIQPQIISHRLKMVIIADNPEWLKIFLLPDSEIYDNQQ